MCVCIFVGKPPNISVVPSSLTIPEGCIAVFTCLDRGRHPQNITWTFGNDTLLTNSTDTLIRTNGDLILLNTTVTDGGMYTCRAAVSTSDEGGEGSVGERVTFDSATLVIIPREPSNETGMVHVHVLPADLLVYIHVHVLVCKVYNISLFANFIRYLVCL